MVSENLTAGDVTLFRGTRGWSQQTFADKLGRSLRAVADYERGKPIPRSLVAQLRALEALEFVERIARMETEPEFDDRTGDGMSGEDAVDTVSGLIREARALTGVTPTLVTTGDLDVH